MDNSFELPNFLGLPGLRVLAEQETWERVYLEAEVDLVLCAGCGAKDGLGDPRPYNRVVINDTPSRGRPTEIWLDQYRHRCAPCARTFVGSAPEVDTRRRMTRRLIRYIEDSVMRRPRSEIAKEVGVHSDRVKAIALGLADRLTGHRFPTPRILGVDDIKMNRKTYTIFTDSERGHAIGLIETAKRPQIEQWIIANLDRSHVEVVVSDLARTIAEAVSFALPNALHVVDRWHVLQACQKATSAVISQILAPLDKDAKKNKANGIKAASNAPRKAAKTLRNLRPYLLGRQHGRVLEGKRTLFDQKLLEPVLADYERLSRAFYARVDLARIYDAADEADARGQLAKFYKSSGHPSIAEEMAGVVKRMKRHQRLILNYYAAKDRFPDVPVAALTTSSTENRNGKLRRSWKAGIGVRNFSYLRMLALYEPWRLDRDILLCGGVVGSKPCRGVSGPVSLVPGLVGQNPARPIEAPSAWRCQSCSPPTSGIVQMP